MIAEKTIEILKRNQAVNDKILKETTLAYDNGLTEQENVEQFEIIKGNVENNIKASERLKGIAYQMLNIAIGTAIDTQVVLTDTLESLVVESTDLNLLVEEFDITNHIDFRIAENDRETKRLMVQLEKK